MSLYLELKNTTQQNPDAPAIIEKDQTYSYENLINEIDKVASSLKQFGVTPEDHIGLFCLNQLEYIHLLFGINKLGAVAVPYNVMQPENVIEYCIEDSDVQLLFVSYELLPKIKNLLPQFLARGIKIIVINGELKDFDEIVSYKDFLNIPADETTVNENPDSVAVMLYTSGTTGLPKGVLLTNKNLLSNVKGFNKVVKLPAFSKSILALPLFHSFGQIVLLVCIFGNIATILINQFLPATILKTMMSYKPEVLPLVPTMFDVLLSASVKKGIPLNFIKFCVTGGASIPYALIEKLKTVTDACIIEGYGLTETSPVITISDSVNFYKPESVGKALPGLTVTLEEDGEIVVKGDSVSPGYWKKYEETAKSYSDDGYFKTGDVGYIDDDGFVFITDRKKDLIIRAGENISPKQIEDVLYHAKGVNDVAVFGVKDSKLGEAIYCAVESEEMIDVTYLKEFCKDKLPRHLVPEEFLIMPKLPRNALGKILKFKLKEMFAVTV